MLNSKALASMTLIALAGSLACGEERELDSLRVAAGTELELTSSEPGEALVLHVAGSLQIEGTLRCTSPLRIYAQGSIEVAEGARIEAPGEVWLEAGPETTSWIRGSVEVLPRDEVGGILTLLGDRLGLDQRAELVADGERVGGRIRVGGGPLGASLSGPSAKRVYVGEGALLRASASRQGDGGRIVIWGDEVARCYGRLDAGDAGGQGGEVEVSGAEVDYSGEVWVGRGGVFRIDPTTITITDGGPSVAPQLDVAFGDAAPTTIAELTLEGTTAGQNATIVLQARNSIDFNQMTDGSVTFSASVNVFLQTRNDVGMGDSATGGISSPTASIGARIVTSSGGSVTLEAGSGGTTGSANVGERVTVSASGAVVVRASGNIRLSLVSGTSATLTAQGAVLQNNGGAGILLGAGGSAIVVASSLGLVGTPFRVARAGSLSVDTSGANGDQFISKQIGSFSLAGLDLNAGTGSITMTAASTSSGAIATDSDAAVDVRASSLTVTATGASHPFGTAANPIQTQVTTLTLDSSAVNSALHVHDLASPTTFSIQAGSGTVSYRVGTGNLVDTGSTLATTGALTLQADAGTIGTGGDVFDLPAVSSLTTNTATGNTDQFLSLAGGLASLDLNAGTGNVTLSTVVGSVLDTDAAVDVRGGVVSLSISAPNSLGSALNPVQTQAASLVVAGGFVFLNELDGLSGLNLSGTSATLTAGGAVTDTDAAVDVAVNFPVITVNNGDFGTSTNPIECSSTGMTVVTTTGNGSQFVDKTVVGGPNDFRAGTGNITLTALNVLDTDGAVDFTCGNLSLTTSTGPQGSSGNPLGLSVASLTANSSAANQNQFFSEANTLTALNLSAGTGNVTLTSGGAISDVDGAADVSCNVATITAGTGGVGSAGNPIGTAVTDLSVATMNGDQFIAETDTLTGLNLSAGSGGITLTSGGALSDTVGAPDFACGALSLTTNAALGTSGNPLDLSAGTLTTSTSGGNANQFFVEANGLTGLDLNAGTGGITLTSTTGTVFDGDGAVDVTGGAIAITVTAGTLGVMGTPVNFAASTSLTTDTSAGNNDQYLTSAGTLPVTGASGLNAGTGTVFVGGGILQVTGSTTAGLVQMNGGTLGGSGTLGAVTVNTGASLAPGVSPGILNTGNLNLAAGSTTTMEIGGATAGTGAGFHDQLNVTGTVTINATATLSTVAFGGFVPSIGDSYTLINNDGADAITGTFQGLAEGASIEPFLGSALAAQVSYVGGDGNDFVLTVVQTADLAVAKTVDSTTSSERARINYTVTVTNKGPAAASNVQLTDALPAGLTLVTPTPSQGTYSAGSGLWSVGSLANGASATLTLEVTVNAGTAGTTITNTTSGLSGTVLGGSTADDVGSVGVTIPAGATGGGSPLLQRGGSGRVVVKKGEDCSLGLDADPSAGWAALLTVLLALVVLRANHARSPASRRAH